MKQNLIIGFFCGSLFFIIVYVFGNLLMTTDETGSKSVLSDELKFNNNEIVKNENEFMNKSKNEDFPFEDKKGASEEWLKKKEDFEKNWKSRNNDLEKESHFFQRDEKSFDKNESLEKRLKNIERINKDEKWKRTTKKMMENKMEQKIKENRSETSTLKNKTREISKNDISCYDDESSTESLQNFHSIFEKQDEFGISNENIFFHETSCFNEEGIIINSRQACAVESAAKMNPNMTIYLLILSPGKLSKESMKIFKLLTSYENVKIRRIFMKDYVKNTPLEKFYLNGAIKSSGWPRSHMSDILRYLTLWKFGGIYLDLDVVVITSLDDLRNFAGAQDPEVIAAGVIGFEKNGFGRKIANACINDLRKNFRGDIWGHNGPGVITRTLGKICNTTRIENMTKERCQGFQLFPPATFYPIPYWQWRLYFEKDEKNETMKIIESAKIIHVWNALSANEIVKVGSRVPYDIIAEKYCPRIYENSEKTF